MTVRNRATTITESLMKKRMTSVCNPLVEDLVQ